MGWRKPPLCLPAIVPVSAVSEAPVGRSPAGRSASPTRTSSGIGEIELRGGSITSGYIDNPEANRAGSLPTVGSVPGIWALSIATVSCSSLAGPRRSWFWAAAKR